MVKESLRESRLRYSLLASHFSASDSSVSYHVVIYNDVATACWGAAKRCTELSCLEPSFGGVGSRTAAGSVPGDKGHHQRQAFEHTATLLLTILWGSANVLRLCTW